MDTHRKSALIPLLSSVILSLITIGALAYLRDTRFKELALTVALFVLLTVFLLFIIYFLVATFKRSIWLPSMGSSVVIYIGATIIMLSYYFTVEDIVIFARWDPTIAALGIAIIALGIAFLPRYQPLDSEEVLKELGERISDFGTKLETFKETQNRAEYLVSSISDESQKFLEKLVKKLH